METRPYNSKLKMAIEFLVEEVHGEDGEAGQEARASDVVDDGVCGGKSFVSSNLPLGDWAVPGPIAVSPDPEGVEGELDGVVALRRPLDRPGAVEPPASGAARVEAHVGPDLSALQGVSHGSEGYPERG